MRTSRWLILLVALILLAGAAALLFLIGAPRVEIVSPAPGAANIPPAAPLRLTFSRPMQPGSIETRLSFEPPAAGEFTWQGSTLTFTPDEPWPGGVTVTVRLAGGAQAQGFPALPLMAAQSWTFAVETPLMAYLWPSDGPANLYTLDPLTGSVIQLTQSGNIEDYRVSLDGAAIFYTASNPAGGADIYRLDRLGGAVEIILDCGEKRCAAPRPSPAADALVYDRYDKTGVDLLSPQVWLLPLTGGAAAPGRGAAPLTPLGSPGAAVWSAQGKLAYFNSYRSAFILLDPQTGSESIFPNRTGWPGDWSPDGLAFIAPEVAVTFSSGALSLQASDLIAYDLPRGASATLITQNFEENSTPAFSPDGQWLAFARKTIDPTHFSSDQQIWRARADGSDLRQLTDTPLFAHYSLVWSPDSSQIAFVRANQNRLTEPLELWLMDANGGNALLLVYKGFAPQWIP